jgi:hypothetical protein
VRSVDASTTVPDSLQTLGQDPAQNSSKSFGRTRLRIGAKRVSTVKARWGMARVALAAPRRPVHSQPALHMVVLFWSETCIAWLIGSSHGGFWLPGIESNFDSFCLQNRKASLLDHHVQLPHDSAPKQIVARRSRQSGALALPTKGLPPVRTCLALFCLCDACAPLERLSHLVASTATTKPPLDRLSQLH